MLSANVPTIQYSQSHTWLGLEYRKAPYVVMNKSQETEQLVGRPVDVDFPVIVSTVKPHLNRLGGR